MDCQQVYITLTMTFATGRSIVQLDLLLSASKLGNLLVRSVTEVHGLSRRRMHERHHTMFRLSIIPADDFPVLCQDQAQLNLALANHSGVIYGSP